jgi:hypothetical protein
VFTVTTLLFALFTAAPALVPARTARTWYRYSVSGFRPVSSKKVPEILLWMVVNAPVPEARSSS